MLLRSVLSLVWLLGMMSVAFAQDGVPAAHFEGAQGAAEISQAVSKLSRQSVKATAHGKTASYQGYDLWDALKASGAAPSEELKGKQLTRLVRVAARDGHEVVFALAELDPTLGNAHALLVDREDGAALPQKDGPWRLVIAAETRPARWIRQIATINASPP